MRILVADDDPTVRLLLVAHLEADGHTVETVEEGTAALAAVRQNRPDALVMDVMMPGLTGWEVLQALRAEGLRERHPAGASAVPPAPGAQHQPVAVRVLDRDAPGVPVGVAGRDARLGALRPHPLRAPVATS